MIISSAWAQAAGGAAPGGLLGSISSFVPLILIAAVMYLLVLRPQQKKVQQHRSAVAALKEKDIVAVNGVIGKVTKASEPDEVMVEIADGVRVRVLRAAITQIMAPAGTPAVGKK
ncbi:MAG TPA: preprotein translocase subunit YajC [Dongiaceae bacterium]|jgi:preprotein translocase subunit YajC|nr:preprotein translocase subunit YajC [Dongiaceae bacterium]